MTLLVLAAPRVLAETLSVTNLQLLYGGPFDDSFFKLDTANKQMLTLTFEHFGTWRYGDNYFFVDLYFGDFVDAAGQSTGQRTRMFAKYNPRLSLCKIFGSDCRSLKVLRDVLLAGQLQVDGTGFWAYLVGASIDLPLPSPLAVSLEAFYRRDAYNGPQWQLSIFWEVPFHLGWVWFAYRGYVDVVGTDALGIDVSGQPQLLVDVGSLIRKQRDKLQVGVEGSFHRNDRLASQALQGMVRWIW